VHLATAHNAGVAARSSPSAVYFIHLSMSIHYGKIDQNFSIGKGICTSPDPETEAAGPWKLNKQVFL